MESLNAGISSTKTKKLILLVVLLSSAHTANILCTVAIPGSHFFLTKSIAELLVERGHNVTFASATLETRVKLHPDIHYITPTKEGVGYVKLEDYFDNMDQVISKELIEIPSEDMALAFFTKDDRQLKLFSDQVKTTANYYVSEEFLDILRNGNFDLIIAEETSIIPVVFINNQFKIPFVGVAAFADVGYIRDRYNLPNLLNSEYSILFTTVALESPSFKTRLKKLQECFTFFHKYFSGFLLTQEFYKRYIEPFGVISFREGVKAIDLQIVNNHPVTSFPFLAPPNVLYLGNLLHKTAESTSPLPKEYTDFITRCHHANVIYVSFGSYLWNLTKVEWMDDFLDYLMDVDGCIILKATHGIDVNKYPKDRFLISSWIPQKSLLASGMLSFFISHCGNNGRMEAIFYNVPVLCIPLFADQLGNSHLVQRNNFGLVLYKEDLSRKSVVAASKNMIDRNNEFKSNMERARYFMENDPSTSLENIFFHIDYLIKYGNVDFLINEVILKQSMVEVYNLDILSIILFILLAILYFIYKILKLMITRACGYKKQKTD